MESKGSQVRALLVFSTLQSADRTSKSLPSVRQRAWPSSACHGTLSQHCQRSEDTNKRQSQWTQCPTTYNFRPSANWAAAWMATVRLLSSHFSLHVHWNFLNPSLSEQKSQQASGKDAMSRTPCPHNGAKTWMENSSNPRLLWMWQ